LSVSDGARDRLLRALDGVNIKVYASGHLHRFEIGRHGHRLRVVAPSTAAVSRGHDELAGAGLRQLGLVEYRCEASDVDVFFRSVPELVEGAARDIEQFELTAQAMGVTWPGPIVTPPEFSLRSSSTTTPTPSRSSAETT
jgi:hypothetical protein